MKNQYSFIITIVFVFLSVSLQAQIKKIEPPFWWSGMQKTELQLMVYGDNISSLTPEIDGLEISAVSADLYGHRAVQIFRAILPRDRALKRPRPLSYHQGHRPR